MAFEALFGTEGTGPADWWRDYADPTMTALMSAEGPFRSCGPIRHDPPKPLPLAEVPSLLLSHPDPPTLEEKTMDEDSTDDVGRALMSLSAGSARALEVALRAARDQKARDAAQLKRDNDGAIRRLMGTAAAAERHFAVVDIDWMHAASAADVANAWEASQCWAEIDPARIGAYSERINTAATEVAGVDLRSAVDHRTLTLEEASHTLAGADDQHSTPEPLDPSADADADVAHGLERTATSRRKRRRRRPPRRAWRSRR